MKKSTAKGVALMLCAMSILPLLDFCAKILVQQGIAPLQIVWARVTFGAILTLPMLLISSGPEWVKPRLSHMQFIRAGLLIIATSCFFASLHYLAVADAIAIFFVQPIVTTLVSALFLREVVVPRRWVAAIIGFCGTLIIIRPGFEEINAGVLLALSAGCMLSLYMIFTKHISGSAPAIATNFYTNLAGAVIMAFIIPFVWQRPEPQQWLLLIAIACIAATGHLLVIKAFEYADASLLAPLSYTEMITATLVGWYVFGDLPDRWTFLGVGLLVVCAIITATANRRPLEQDFEQP